MSNVKRVGAYLRVSTMNQVTEHDSSLDTQHQRIRSRTEYETKQAAARGSNEWKLVAEYREEGRSGKNTDRPELQRLLDDVRAGKLDVVLVTKLDRITRSLLDFYTLWGVFEEHEVEFIALDDNFDTSGATGRAMLKIALVFAELERERTSERTKEKAQMRRSAGMWFGGNFPFGYKPHPTNPSTLEVDAPAAETVRKEFFEKFLEIGSVRGLTRHLQRRNIGRAERESRRGKKLGGAFTVQGVQHILSNRAYLAERVADDGAIIKCNWQPLVSADLFQQVQDRLAQNSVKRPQVRPSKKHVFLLESLLRCGTCKSMMGHASGTGRTGEYFYYRCGRKHRTAGEGCATRDVPAQLVEDFVLDQLGALTMNKGTIQGAVREANAGRDKVVSALYNELTTAKAANQQIEGAIARLLDAVEQGHETDEHVLARLKEKEIVSRAIKADVERLEARRQAMLQDVLDGEAVADGYQRFVRLFEGARRAGALAELKELLQAFVDCVEWHADPADPKKGTALIQLYDLPAEIWDQAPEATVNQQGVGSLSWKKWLRHLDSNQGPAD